LYGAQVLSEDTLPLLLEALPPRNDMVVDDLFEMSA
jgi:hypothetical protein